MKNYILVLLFGIVIMLGGCVPFGIAINNAMNTNEVLNESIAINKNDVIDIIKVDTTHLVLPALKIHFSSNQISHNTLPQSSDYEAKFQFPISLIIRDRNDKKLYQHTGKLDWRYGSKSYDLNNVDSQQAEVIVEIDLDKIAIPNPGEIKLAVFIGNDTVYHATLHSARLIVYDNVFRHNATILTGVAIILLGVIVFVIGLILFIRYQAIKTNAQNSKQSAAVISNDTETDPTKTNSSINNSAMLCHLMTFSGLMVPLGGVLGPLIMWLVKKDEHAFVNRHGIAAVNFHLSMMLYYFVSFLLAFVIIGFFFLILLALADFILSIIGSIKASNGEEFRYPLAIPFISDVKK